MKNRKKYERSKQAGFSLTELLVVICGFSILATIGVPAVETVMDNYGVVMAAQQITNNLQSARMRAVSSNEPFRVHFLQATNTYQIETGAGALHSGPFFLPRGTVFTAVTFSANYVSFEPSGRIPTSGNGSAGRVKIVNRSGVRIDIVVNTGGMIRATPTYKTSTPPF